MASNTGKGCTENLATIGWGASSWRSGRNLGNLFVLSWQVIRGGKERVVSYSLLAPTCQ